MQAKTERRLGFIAAIALTTAAFTAPPIAPLKSYVEQELSGQTSITLTIEHTASNHLKLAGLEKHF